MKYTAVDIKILLPHEPGHGHMQQMGYLSGTIEDAKRLWAPEMDWRIEASGIVKLPKNASIDDLPKPTFYMAVVRDDEEDMRFRKLYKTEESAVYGICRYIDDAEVFPDVKVQDIGTVRNLTNWDKQPDGELTLDDYPYGGWRMTIAPMTVSD